MSITNKIIQNVSMFPDGRNTCIPVSQYDVGSTIRVNIVGDIPDGAKAQVMGTKKSGFGFTSDAEIEGNLVLFTLSTHMTDEGGRVPAEIRFTKDDMNVGTANFILDVEYSPHPDGTIDGAKEARTLLKKVEEALEKVDEVVEKADKALDEVSDAAEAAETAASDANTAAEEALKATEDAKSAAQEAREAVEGFEEELKERTSKEAILAELGYEEYIITMTDEDGTKVKAHVLGYVEEEEPEKDSNVILDTSGFATQMSGTRYAIPVALLNTNAKIPEHDFTVDMTYSGVHLPDGQTIEAGSGQADAELGSEQIVYFEFLGVEAWNYIALDISYDETTRKVIGAGITIPPYGGTLEGGVLFDELKIEIH